MGIRSQVSRNTLSNANSMRDWGIYADFAQVLINIARKLYMNEGLEHDLTETVYALDSTTIDLCLSLFPWAKFRKHKGAVKMHTLLDIQGNIPTVIFITTGKVHDVNILDNLLIETGAFYVMDRGYVDFARLNRIHLAAGYFVTRAKKGFKFKRLYSATVDKTSGVLFDQTIRVTGQKTRQEYPDKLRRIGFWDEETKRRLIFITNNFVLPSIIIAQLYKKRWQVELFFKWIKQNLRIKTFYGTSENAVKTQIWIAISVYVLVAIVKKRLNLEMSLYTILQIISVTIFEKRPILEVLSLNNYTEPIIANYNQPNLFE